MYQQWHPVGVQAEGKATIAKNNVEKKNMRAYNMTKKKKTPRFFLSPPTSFIHKAKKYCSFTVIVLI